MYCLCTNEVALIEVSFIKSNSGFFYSFKVDVSDRNSLGIMMIRMNSISVVCKTNCCVHTCYIGSFDSSKQTLSVCVVELIETKEYSWGKRISNVIFTNQVQLDLFPEPKKIWVTLPGHCSELLHIDGKDWLLIMRYIFVESCVDEQHIVKSSN